MEITKSSSQGIHLLTVAGKLDSNNASEFDARLREYIEEDSGQPVILDFSGVQTLTSAPLRAILSLAKRMQRHHSKLLLAAPSENALESLRISGFLKLKIFDLTDSLDSAVAQAKRAPAAVTPPAALPTTAAPRPSAKPQGGPLPTLPTAPSPAPPPSARSALSAALQTAAPVAAPAPAAPPPAAPPPAAPPPAAPPPAAPPPAAPPPAAPPPAAPPPAAPPPAAPPLATAPPPVARPLVAKSITPPPVARTVAGPPIVPPPSATSPAIPSPPPRSHPSPRVSLPPPTPEAGETDSSDGSTTGPSKFRMPWTTGSAFSAKRNKDSAWWLQRGIPRNFTQFQDP